MSEAGVTLQEAHAPGSFRREGRILALQALYEADLVGHAPVEALEHNLEEAGADSKAIRFGRELIDGVLKNREVIDLALAAAAPAWPVAQMPAVDKNLLRLAIYEVLFDNRRVPVKAAINEAVEIAKGFGGENSSRFVNGVLGTVAAENVGRS